MIGNRGYATYIRDWVRDEQKRTGGSYYCPREAPAGWKYIGQGCYRAAYLAPDGVIYKVQAHEQSYQSNLSEYKKYNLLRIQHRMPEGARFPLMCNFRIEGADTINAMDYVGPVLSQYEGPDRQKHVATLSTIAWRLNIGDMHQGNAAVDEKLGVIVPIDLGQ